MKIVQHIVLIQINGYVQHVDHKVKKYVALFLVIERPQSPGQMKDEMSIETKNPPTVSKPQASSAGQGRCKIEKAVLYLPPRKWSKFVIAAPTTNHGRYPSWPLCL